MKEGKISINRDQYSILYDALQDRLINLEDGQPKHPDRCEWYEYQIREVNFLMAIVYAAMVQLPDELKTSHQCDCSPSMETVFSAMEGGRE